MSRSALSRLLGGSAAPRRRAMRELAEALKAQNRRILNGGPAGLASSARDLERALERVERSALPLQPDDAENLEALRGTAARNLRLLEAVRAGLADARRDLDVLATEAGALAYGSDGRRIRARSRAEGRKA
jgi:hypothetical protein